MPYLRRGHCMMNDMIPNFMQLALNYLSLNVNII
jgi:hypothetical protein